MVLTIVEELSYRRVTIADEVRPIEIANKVFCSATTKETARINVHYHHPFGLIRIAINGELEEIRAFKLVWLCTISFAKSTDVGPVFQVRRRIETHFFVGRDYHIPSLQRFIPEDLWVAKVFHTIERFQDRVLLILMEGVTAIGAISHTLRLGILLAVRSVQRDDSIPTITSRTIPIYDRTTREDMSLMVANERRLNLLPANKVTTSLRICHSCANKPMGVASLISFS
mgnify:CR=1 FL=1